MSVCPYGMFLRTDELVTGMEISTQDGDGVSVIEVIKTTDRANGPDAPIGGASAFSSRLAAEELVGTVLAKRSTDIKNYLSRSRGPNSKRVLDFETGQATGRWTPNGGSATQSVSGVRVVIKPDAFVPSGYRVITAHPIPSSQIKPNN